MSVLIVEDDEGVQHAIAEVLRDEGYEVTVAANGGEALELLRRGELPQLILLDLMMPGMDGIEFRQRQLADPRLSRIPVIVISARPDVARQARRLQADDFLAKPMSFRALLHVVQNRAVTLVTTNRLPGHPKTLREAWSRLRDVDRDE
jgi:two-component system, chemotaxis family, chemotaxis protein CheY